jgi:arginine transport system permease protein
MTDYFLSMLNGLGITLILMLASVFFGFLLALLFTAGQLTSRLWIKKPIEALSFFIRGTPLLVQLFLIYYGSGQFDFIRDSILWDVLRSPMACAIIALSLNTACYTSVLLLGAIQSVPKNEIDACAALGMSKWQAIRRIIFPIAFRIALPAYSNEVIIILKCTSLASTITLLDLMGVTQQLISQTYQTIQLYCLAGAIYLVLNVFILSVFHQIEARLRVNL